MQGNVLTSNREARAVASHPIGCNQERLAQSRSNWTMISAAKFPCDEAAIISRKCDTPAQSGRWVLAASILGSSMAFIDGTVVNVALPAMQSSLHATVSDIQW